MEWFALPSHTYKEAKYRLIKRMDHGRIYLNIWFELLCTAGELARGGLVELDRGRPFTAEELGIIWEEETGDVEAALSVFEKYNLITRQDGFIYIHDWDRYQKGESVEKLRRLQEANAQRQRIFRENKKLREAAEKMPLAGTEPEAPAAAKTVCKTENSKEKMTESKAQEKVPERAKAPEKPLEGKTQKSLPEAKETPKEPKAPAPQERAASGQQETRRKSVPAPPPAPQKIPALPGPKHGSPRTEKKLVLEKDSRGALTETVLPKTVEALMTHQIGRVQAENLIRQYGDAEVRKAIRYFESRLKGKNIANIPAYLIALIRANATLPEPEEFIPCPHKGCQNGIVIVTEDDGYTHATYCPTCHGKGKILKTEGAVEQTRLQM